MKRVRCDGELSDALFFGTAVTAERLLDSDSHKKVRSTTGAAYVKGTTNQINVTDNVDGTATLSLNRALQVTDNNCTFLMSDAKSDHYISMGAQTAGTFITLKNSNENSLASLGPLTLSSGVSEMTINATPVKLTNNSGSYLKWDGTNLESKSALNVKCGSELDLSFWAPGSTSTITLTQGSNNLEWNSGNLTSNVDFILRGTTNKNMTFKTQGSGVTALDCSSTSNVMLQENGVTRFRTCSTGLSCLSGNGVSFNNGYRDDLGSYSVYMHSGVDGGGYESPLRVVGSNDAASRRWVQFGNFTSDNPALTFNRGIVINTYTGQLMCDNKLGSIAVANVTTSEKGSLSAVTGNLCYDSTLGKLCFYDGGSWRTITST